MKIRKQSKHETYIAPLAIWLLYTAKRLSLLYCGMMAPFHCCRRWAFQILSFPLFLCCSFRGFQPHIWLHLDLAFVLVLAFAFAPAFSWSLDAAWYRNALRWPGPRPTGGHKAWRVLGNVEPLGHRACILAAFFAFFFYTQWESSSAFYTWPREHAWSFSVTLKGDGMVGI